MAQRDTTDYTALPTLVGTPPSVIRDLVDAGQVYAEMANGRFWQVRLNGATKTLKRDATWFSIPAKAGLKACFRIEPWNLGELRIKRAA